VLLSYLGVALQLSGNDLITVQSGDLGRVRVVDLQQQDAVLLQKSLKVFPISLQKIGS
jgi:hypothetical protein